MASPDFFMQEFSSRNFYFSPGSFMGDCYRYKTKTRPKARHCLSTGGDGVRLRRTFMEFQAVSIYNKKARFPSKI